MTKRDVIHFLFKWKLSLIGYFLLVVAGVTALVFVLPQKYAASSSVLVESNRAPVMRSDVALGADEITVLNSAIAILESRTVLSSAVDKVGLEESDEEPSTIERMISSAMLWLEETGLKEPMTPREALIKRLEDNVDVEPLANSNVITISLKGKNPAWTATIVNAVTDSYIEHHLRVFSSKGTSQLYRAQVERLAQDLDRRRAALAEYKMNASVIALDETRHALVQQQSDLTAEQAQARADLAELQTRFGPGHTRIVLAEERLAQIERSLEEARTKLQVLEMEQATVADMETRIRALEASYQDYQRRYEEARLNDQANPDVVNVRVIEYASVPTRADHSRIFYVALAVAGGLILTFGIALIREYFDHSVSDSRAVSELLGVPILGSIERRRFVF